MNRFEVLIAQLSRSQKLDLLEILWTDMTGNEKNLESPVWHEDILNAREAALSSRKIFASNWDEAKERIKNNVSCGCRKSPPSGHLL
jgi:hypothetical protein